MTTAERYRITIYVGYEVVLHKAPGAHNPSQRSKLLCCIIHPVQGEESFQLPSAGPGEGLSPSTSPQKPPLPPKPLCIPEQGAGVGLVLPGVSKPTPTASSKATSPSSSLPSRDILTGSGSSQGSPGTSTGTGGYEEESPSESPHKDFHCAVLKALSTTNTELPALTEVPGTD